MEITEYLPVDFRTQMEAETLCGAEEIRLRVGQPLEILYADEKKRLGCSRKHICGRY